MAESSTGRMYIKEIVDNYAMATPLELLLYSAVIYPIVYIFPAYAANGAPVLFGGGKPLDRRKKLHGKRILGDNKTVSGLVAALVCGITVGVIEYPFFHYMLYIAPLLTLGAIVGDLIGSFIKRRYNIPSGRSVLLLDQYGFFALALLFAFWLGHLPVWYGLLFITLLTGLLHVATNRGAHKLRLKSVPW